MPKILRHVLAGMLNVLGAQVWVTPGLVRITAYAPRLAGWPDGMHLRIAMLSDLHVARPWFGPEALAGVVDKVNAIAPDLILLLGDFEDGPRFSQAVAAQEWAEPLRGLVAPLGIHAVLGNHDYPEDGGRHRALRDPAARLALEAIGVQVYVNRALRLSWHGQAFWLAGLGDQVSVWPDGRLLAELDGTLSQVTDDAPIILMAHEPDIFPHVPERVTLTISGHLHGGQIRFFGHAPVVPSQYGQRFLHGLIEEQDRSLIVGAGLGMSGLPLRLGAPPEIVVIELGGAGP